MNWRFWKRKPKAWLTISRAGQVTPKPMVSVGATGLYKGGWATQSVYTMEDTPANNANIEGLAKTLGKIFRVPVFDARKTPWDVPRDGMHEHGTFRVEFLDGTPDQWLKPTHMKQIKGDRGPPIPVFNIPGYDVEATIDGRYMAVETLKVPFPERRKPDQLSKPGAIG